MKYHDLKVAERAMMFQHWLEEEKLMNAVTAKNYVACLWNKSKTRHWSKWIRNECLLDYVMAHYFEKRVEYIKSKTAYKNANDKASGAPAAAMKLYKQFLQQV